MRQLLLALVLLYPRASWAANPMCPTRPPGDSTNACASTAFVTTGIAADFASPPPLGNITPNTVAATTLSASGLVSGTGFTNLFASPPPFGTTSPNFVFATALYGTSFGVGTSGIVGDGVTNNNTAFQAALTVAGRAAAPMIIPCGTYILTTGQTATIASNKGIVIKGSGKDCTNLFFQNSAGISLTTESIYSNFEISDLTFITDQAGTFNAITITNGGLNTDPAYSSRSRMTNVNFIGSDSYSGTPTKYWGMGYQGVNISNQVIDGILYLGPASGTGGDIINLVGLTASSGYSVASNIRNVFGVNQGNCVNIRDFTQGVVMNNLNCTDGVNGVQTIASPTGVLSQIYIFDSQFGGNSGIDINIRTPSPSLVDLNISHNLFIDSSGHGGVVANGSRMILDGNDFVSLSAGSGTALTINGNVGSITGGSIEGYAIGTLYNASAFQVNQLGTKMTANTTDYSANSSATNIVIDDKTLRTIAHLWTCQIATTGSRAFVNDVASGVATYHGSVAAGATSVNSPAYCDGSGTWKWD